jgi:hypothetical protein
MRHFAERKRELLLESDINREVLHLEWCRFEMSLRQTREHLTRNIWTWAAPVAGFLLARRLKKTTGVFAKGSVVLMALTKLWDFWQARRARAQGSASAPD